MSHLVPFLHGGFFYVVVFLVVLTVLVFVHELGHYLIARRNGVRVEVFSGSAAEAGGIHSGDAIISIDGRAIARFEDVQQVVRLNPSVPMNMVVRRDGAEISLKVTPSLVEESDRLGRRQIGQLGIRGGGTKYIQRDPGSAVVSAVSETWNLSATTLQAMWQMVIGTRTTDELGEPLRIAPLSGEI